MLVHPRSDNSLAGGVSLSGRAGFARLSLSVVASLTPPNWQVRIHDARRSPPPYDEPVDLVGVTAFTSEAPSAYEIAAAYRKRGIKVVMGGVHASALPEEALQHVDAVVIGEAEEAWPRLLADWEAGRLQQRYMADRLVDLVGLPLPRRDLLDPSLYHHFNTMYATRGCPFDCEFCTVSSFFGRECRTRPVAEVVAEASSFRSRECFFVDDNLVGRPDYAKELFRALIPLKLHWGTQVSITFARDPELVELFARAGGRYALIGFESLSPDNLKAMNKAWNSPNAYAEAVARIRRAGIGIVGSFIFGLDGDDSSVFRRVADFITANHIDAAQFHILTPFPGTRLFAKMDAEGRITSRDWSRYHTGDVIIRPAGMTATELADGYAWAWHETYRWPNILRRLAGPLAGLPARLALNLSYRRKALKVASRQA